MGKKKKRFLLLGSLAQSEDGVGASLLMAPDSFPLSLGDLGFWLTSSFSHSFFFLNLLLWDHFRFTERSWCPALSGNILYQYRPIWQTKKCVSSGLHPTPCFVFFWVGLAYLTPPALSGCCRVSPVLKQSHFISGCIPAVLVARIVLERESWKVAVLSLIRFSPSTGPAQFITRGVGNYWLKKWMVIGIVIMTLSMGFIHCRILSAEQDCGVGPGTFPNKLRA